MRHSRSIIAITLLLLGTFSASGQVRNAGATTRSVTISTQPSAQIWIDGVLHGKTDANGNLTVRSVTTGAHTLKVRAKGYKDKTMPLGTAAKVEAPLVGSTDEADDAFHEAERLTSVDRAQAADAYRKALKLRPTFLDAALGLARISLAAGDYEEAEKAIAQARRISPGNAEASAIMGRILKDEGEEARAIAMYKRAITEGRGFQPEALTGLGLLYKDKAEASGNAGNFDEEDAHYTEAGKYLKQAIKQLSGAPDALVVYQLLGLIYEKQKKNNEAIALYEECLRLFPDAPEVTALRSFIVQLRKSPNN